MYPVRSGIGCVMSSDGIVSIGTCKRFPFCTTSLPALSYMVERCVTQVPILTMPSDDITHPIPDLTGYITEGQIVLGRDLFRQGVYPPVNILMSLSRLMKDGIGEGSTRDDHQEISNQNYDSYSRAQEVRALAGIVGKAGLTDIDLKYMAAGDSFEKKFLAQSLDENRTIEETLGILWDTASKLPRGELTKVKDKHIDKFFKGA